MGSFRGRIGYERGRHQQMHTWERNAGDLQEVVGLTLHRSDTYTHKSVASSFSGHKELTAMGEKDPAQRLAPLKRVLEPKLVIFIVPLNQP